MFGFDTAEEQVEHVLKGEKLNPTFWCKIGFHVWQRWVVKNEGRGRNNAKRYAELNRECKFCGKLQMKTEWETGV